MSESGGETASALAIREKKPQKAGGCIGIFFQLFDWNRRFASKKLFSKKLLLPARSKQASKRFGGDDKQPKLRLISDENTGGFPNVKKNGVGNGVLTQKYEMRAPSLVAKLMGLESMPAVQRGKPKNALPVATGSDRGDEFVNRCMGCEREESCIDKGVAKNDWRPQKLQKTGVSEKRPVAKFGADALQLKNVLSRSRKHHHPKLGSPVKSPRNLSGKNASRLMSAATKILEPGLQRSRARCALTYTNALNHPQHERLMKETTQRSQEEIYNSSYYPGVAVTPTTGQSPCKNCGHMLDILSSRHNIEEKQSDFASSCSHYVSPCSDGSERVMPREFIFYSEPEKRKELDESPSHSVLPTASLKRCSESSSRIWPPKREGQLKWQFTSRQLEPGMYANSPTGFKQKPQMPNRTLQGRDRTPKKSKPSSLPGNRVSPAANAICETKVVVNQSYGCHDRARILAKMDSCKFQTERKIGIRRKDYSMTSVQNKGPTNVCKHYDRSGFENSLSEGTCDGMSRSKENAGSSISCPEIRTRFTHQGEKSRIFNNLVKDKTGMRVDVSNCREQNDSSSETTSRKPVVDQNDLRSTSQKPLTLNGDALSAILEQKLKELISQDEDELVKGGTTPRKTTAMILQELISALTAGKPCHDDLAVQSNNQSDSSHHHVSNVDASFTFKAKPKSTTTLVRCYHDDTERLSPGSVLEASFSNDSCLSSSFGDSSIPGNKQMHDSIGSFHDELNGSELDAALFDSATSLSTAKNSRYAASFLLNSVSEVFRSINLADTVSKVYAKEVLLNAELMLGNSENGFLVTPFLLTELETLSRLIWMSISCTRVWNQLEGFAFDSIIEYLDSRYNRLSKCGFAAWSRTPLHMDKEMLIQEIIEEIRRWRAFAGMIPDELIEWDMSHSLGKWTDFEIEAFETGVEIIDGHIIQLIIDEIVIDLWK